MTRLSVGVPVYNHGKYIKQTILSLLNQEVAPYEIVVSNNHSTDETQDVLKEFEGRIRIITPPDHLPLFQHFNFLISQLSGDWVALMGADDIAKPNWAKVLSSGIGVSKNTVMVRSGLEFIDGAGDVVNRHYLLSLRKITPPPKTFREGLLGPKSNLYFCAFKKETLDKVGRFPQEFALFGDWALYQRLAPHGIFVYQHDIIGQYRTLYRQGLQKRRLAAEIGDEVILYKTFFPAIAQRYFPSENHRIKKAARRVFVRRIATASRLLEPSERASISDGLGELADLADGQYLLERFMQGEVFPWPRANPVRRVLRTAYHALRSYV